MSVKSIHMIVMRMLSALMPLVTLPVLATLDTLEVEPIAVSPSSQHISLDGPDIPVHAHFTIPKC